MSTTLNKELDGMVAIVTGSSKRIGRQIALRLAAGGAAVTVNARSSKNAAEAVVNEIKSTGGRAIACLADVTNPDAVEEMVTSTVSAFGHLNFVIHNAVARNHDNLEDLSLDDWHSALAVVLDGAFLCTKYSVPHLEKTSGTIIYIGGATGFTGGGGPAVPTAKSGLVGLARTIARSYGPKGIKAHVLSLGSISDESDDPDRTKFLLDGRPLNTIPLRRMGKPEDVAETVAMMCGPGMAYATGQVIHLTGGFYMG
jgi:3-oxoacyl-[acyl-carrier protein] reductase